jgi:hypothetical protein
LLQDLAKDLRPHKKLSVEIPENDDGSIDSISPIERHGSMSPDMRPIPEQEEEIFIYESPPPKKIVVYEEPPKKPIMQKRSLRLPKNMPKMVVKNLHNNLSKID